MTTNTSGFYQYDTTGTLVATSAQEVLQAITQNCAPEISVNGGAGVEHIREAYEALYFKATNELGLNPPQFYFYLSAVSPSLQFVIAGPTGMSVASQEQPKHARLGLVLNSTGQILQAGECFITEHAFSEAAPLNPPNQL
jgi:hypothetical protein